MKSVNPQTPLRGITLLFFSLIPSRLLGIVREVLAASFFGAGRAMDAFNISFTVVTGIRQLFAQQLNTPLIPTYFLMKKEVGEEGAMASLQSITSRLLVAALLISIVLFIAAKQIVSIIAPGFDPYYINLSTEMLRWFAVGGIAIILIPYFTSLHTCFFRYTAIALAPLLFNILAISAMIIFAVRFGIVSLAAGLSLGFMGFFLVLLLTLPYRNSQLKLRWGRKDQGVSKYTLLLFPLFIAVSFEQVQLFVDRALASGLPEGALSAQGYALRLVRILSEFLIGTFGTVMFPVFSSLAQENKKEEFASNFSLSLQAIILILALTASLLIALSLPIIRTVLERGAFTYQDSLLTSELLTYYAFAYSAHAMLIIVIRGFHAHGNTRIPTLTTIIAVCVMIAADFILVGPMGIHGLALALVIGYSLNLVLVYSLFTRHLSWKFTLQILKMLMLGVILGIGIVWGITSIWNVLEHQQWVDGFVGRLLGIIVLSSIFSAIYVFILFLLRVPAIGYILAKFSQKKSIDAPSDLSAY